MARELFASLHERFIQWVVLGAFAVGGALACGTLSKAEYGARSANERQTNAAKHPNVGWLTRTARFHGPWLLPRLDVIDIDFLDRTFADRSNLIVDGLRMSLFADGSYQIGSGLLPLGRSINVITLPSRFGGGQLFFVSSASDTWLFRASEVTAELVPLGRLDSKVTAVTPGMTKLILELEPSKILVSFDPNTKQLTSDIELPLLPEYGPMAFVDEGFGAYVDPLRGLLVMSDGSLRFEPIQIALQDNRGKNTLNPFLLGFTKEIEKLSVVGDALSVTVSSGAEFLLTRRGNVIEKDTIQNHLQTSGDATGPTKNALESKGHRHSKNSVRSWLLRLRETSLGGWPIERVLSRGIRISDNLGAYIEQGYVHQVTLDDGKVVKTTDTTVARDSRCQGRSGQNRHYFLCDDRSGNTLYRYDPDATLRRLGRFEPKRTWGAVTDAGVVIHGTCASQSGVEGENHSFCGVANDGEVIDFATSGSSNDVIPVVWSEAQAVVVEPPSSIRSGHMRWFGRRKDSTSLTMSKANVTFVRNGLYVRDVAMRDGKLVGFVVNGNTIAGYQLDRNGALEFGPLMSNGELALTAGPRALIPDSSGYAYESLDAGRTWLRTRLPIAVANTKLTIPSRSQRFGCTTVGCALGDFLRVGWSAEVPSKPPLSSPLVPIESPTRLGMERKRRDLPQITCETKPGNYPSLQKNPKAVVSSRKKLEKKDDVLATRFESTSWLPFFGFNAPKRSIDSLGFDRGFRSDRYLGRIYAQLRPSDEHQTATIDIRVFDGLGRFRPWSSRLHAVQFDDIETPARWFAHPRYGESAVALSTVFDVGGEDGLVVFHDTNASTAYLVSAHDDTVALPDWLGHVPKRITDFVSLNDASYALGSEPQISLFEIRGRSLRIVSNEDFRARLGRSRLRVIRDRKRLRLAFLLSSIRLRVADVSWAVYPMDVETGQFEAPIRISLDRELTVCGEDDDGWLVETEVDEIADVRMPRENPNSISRGRALLVINEQGWCVVRVSFVGHTAVEKLLTVPGKVSNNSFEGTYLDTEGRGRPLTCSLENRASVSE
jgi:hypothetical protein